MNVITNTGEKLEDLMQEQRVLLVFLRHFGCTFCRETMCELANSRDQIEITGTRIIIVHMVSSEMAEEMLKVYDLQGISHISDPKQTLYRKYGLSGAGLRAMFGLKNWYRAFIAGLVKGHLIGKPAGDPWQMPGVFLMEKQRILRRFTYKYVSDLPDFVKLSQLS